MRSRRPPPLAVYLDTNQWNYLIEPPNPPIGLKLDRLQRAVHSGEIEIVGAVDLLEELISASRAQPDKCQRMLQLFRRLVGPRLIRPLDMRHPLEVRHGGLLPMRTRYLANGYRTGLIGLASDEEDLAGCCAGRARGSEGRIPPAAAATA